MPALVFEIEWPDRRVSSHYSPSTVIREYFRAGQSMSVVDLKQVSIEALERASDRVVDKFGFACTASAESLEQILERAARFRPNDMVTIGGIAPPAPQPAENSGAI